MQRVTKQDLPETALRSSRIQPKFSPYRITFEPSLAPPRLPKSYDREVGRFNIRTLS